MTLFLPKIRGTKPYGFAPFLAPEIEYVGDSFSEDLGPLSLGVAGGQSILTASEPTVKIPKLTAAPVQVKAPAAVINPHEAGASTGTAIAATATTMLRIVAKGFLPPPLPGLMKNSTR